MNTGPGALNDSTRIEAFLGDNEGTREGEGVNLPAVPDLARAEPGRLGSARWPSEPIGGPKAGGGFPAEMSRLNAKILVAEDDPENRRVICLRLSMMGAAVTLAQNGLEAVEQARAARDNGDPFDLVLMDMQMPVLDGYEATSTLRDEGFRAPVVAVTACVLPEDRDECLAFGCDAHVGKPVDWRLLGELLARLLQGESEDPEAD